MIFIYLACLIIGGILLGGSLLLGSLHGDADGDGDADHDGDVGHDAEHDAEHGGFHGEGDADAAGLWLPFLSIRFWVFSLCFFGLCGTLLTIIGIGSILTGVVSLLVGLVCGTGAAYVVHRLGKSDASGEVATPRDYVGVLGSVLVPIEPGRKGKVRISVRDNTIDLIATTSDDAPLAVGQQVLVVEYEDSVASVTTAPEGGGGGN